jgi:hypothetical protein
MAVLSFVLLLACGLAAAVNVAVDPFGYFDLNQTGLFFDDERTFKLLQVRRYPHDALLLGDSRSAYVDIGPIAAPRFFNAAFGGASLDEIVWFWEHYTGNARVVVLGMLESDAGGEAKLGEQFANRSWRDPFRYALSFELLGRSLESVRRWRAGEPPTYHDNGSRIIARKYIGEAIEHGSASPLVLSPYVPGGTPPNTAARNLCSGPAPRRPGADAIPPGWKRIGRMAELARERDAKLILFLQPRHQTVLDEDPRGYPGPPEMLTAYICDLGLDFFDLTANYTNPDYYWATDHTHYFPAVGLSVLEEILRATGVPVEVE